MRFFVLMGLAVAVVVAPARASAQASDDWSLGLGGGYASVGDLKARPNGSNAVEARRLRGASAALSLDRVLLDGGSWRVSGGGELGYLDADTDTLVGARGSAHLSRTTGFAVVSVQRTASFTQPFAGVGVGVVHDRLRLKTEDEDITVSRTTPAAKAFAGVEWDTKPVAFGFSVGATSTFGKGPR
jgi:outer membrane scaffolding protein for murein synthesis (MipA/OmpV family)